MKMQRRSFLVTLIAFILAVRAVFARLGRGTSVQDTDGDLGEDAPRVMFLALQSHGTVAPGETFRVSVYPQQPLALRKLLISIPVAANFRIDQIRLNNEDLFSVGEPVPAELFTPDAPHVPYRTIRPNAAIEFTVTNVSDRSATFRAAVSGYIASRRQHAEAIVHHLSRRALFRPFTRLAA